MTRITRRIALALATALSLGGCVTGHRSAAADAPTYVQVRNQSWSEQTVYVVHGGQRLRLGIVGATSSARFQIPPSIIAGPTGLRFVTDPLAGRTSSVSMEITVSPGDEVSMTIPPS